MMQLDIEMKAERIIALETENDDLQQQLEFERKKNANKDMLDAFRLEN